MFKLKLKHISQWSDVYAVANWLLNSGNVINIYSPTQMKLRTWMTFIAIEEEDALCEMLIEHSWMALHQQMCQTESSCER